MQSSQCRNKNLTNLAKGKFDVFEYSAPISKSWPTVYGTPLIFDWVPKIAIVQCRQIYSFLRRLNSASYLHLYIEFFYILITAFH